MRESALSIDVKVKERKAIVTLELGFEDRVSKNLTAYLNGKSIGVETTDLEWKTRINDFIVEGQNWVRLVPVKSLVVNKIDVYVE